MTYLKEGAMCPQCEQGTLKITRKDLSFSYKGKNCEFKAERLFTCDRCDYEALDWDDTHRIDKELTEFRRKIDGLLSGKELESIRKSLGLNKKKMAKLLSVNEKTIGRYESNKMTQSEQIDKLYRIFRDRPETTNLADLNTSLPALTLNSYVWPTASRIPVYSYSGYTLLLECPTTISASTCTINVTATSVSVGVIPSGKLSGPMSTGLDRDEGKEYARAA